MITVGLIILYIGVGSVIYAGTLAFRQATFVWRQTQYPFAIIPEDYFDSLTVAILMGVTCPVSWIVVAFGTRCFRYGLKFY